MSGGRLPFPALRPGRAGSGCGSSSGAPGSAGRLFGCPYGDQALFVRKQRRWSGMGGVPRRRIMEDLDLVAALKRRLGASRSCPWRRRPRRGATLSGRRSRPDDGVAPRSWPRLALAGSASIARASRRWWVRRMSAAGQSRRPPRSLRSGDGRLAGAPRAPAAVGLHPIATGSTTPAGSVLTLGVRRRLRRGCPILVGWAIQGRWWNGLSPTRRCCDALCLAPARWRSCAPVLRYFSRTLVFNAAREVEYEIRNDLFAHLQRLPQSFYLQVAHRRPDEPLRRTTSTRVRLMLGPGVLSSCRRPDPVPGTFVAMFDAEPGSSRCW